MLALSIRQPYAELILRGMKTIEYRSRTTRIIGERFWIYASQKWAGARGQGTREGTGVRGQGTGRSAHSALSPQSLVLRSDNIVVDAPPPWMVELANGLRLFQHELPTGVIVGSAVIEKVTSRDDGMFEWHLADVERAKRLRKPKAHPQPVWWRNEA